MISITLKGGEELQKRLRQGGTKLRSIMGEALEASLVYIKSCVQKQVAQTTQSHSAFLRNRWDLSVSKDRASITSGVKYARYLEEGTRPYTIYPNEKKALFWKGAAYPVKKVNHPGIKARHFMEYGLKDALPGMKKIFERAVNMIFE